MVRRAFRAEENKTALTALLMERLEDIRINGREDPSLVFTQMDQIFSQLFTIDIIISDKEQVRYTIRLISENRTGIYQHLHQTLLAGGDCDSWTLQQLRTRIQAVYISSARSELRRINLIQNQSNNERTRNPRRRTPATRRVVEGRGQEYRRTGRC